MIVDKTKKKKRKKRYEKTRSKEHYRLGFILDDRK